MAIISHYFKRYSRDLLGVGIYVLFPVVLLALFHTVNVYHADESLSLIPGYDLSASFNMIVNLLLFQLMGSLLVIDFLFVDLREDMRWRIGVAPVSQFKLIFGNMVGAFCFAVLSGLILIGVSAVFFDAYMHNWAVLLAVLVLVGLISQGFGVLLFFLCKKKRTANTCGMLFCWVMVLMSGMFMGINFGETVSNIGARFTPFGMGVRAIINSGTVNDFPGWFDDFSGAGMGEAWLNVGMLAGVTAVLFVVLFLISRRRGL
jgi:hypothetical protein